MSRAKTLEVLHYELQLKLESMKALQRVSEDKFAEEFQI